MTHFTDARPRTAALSTTALTLIVTALLARLDLAAPPVTGLVAFRTFVEVHGAVPSAFGLLRVLAILGASYVLAISSLASFASLGSPSATFYRAVRAVTLPPLRHLVPGLLGTGLVLLPAIQTPLIASAIGKGAPNTSTRTSGAEQAAAPSRRHQESDALVRLPSPSPSTTETGETIRNEGTASLILIGPDETTSSTTSTTPTAHFADTTISPASITAPTTTKRTGQLPIASPAVAVSPPKAGVDRSAGKTRSDHPTSVQHPTAARSSNDATWTVVPGDHLWHIAAATVSDSLHHAANDGQITPYWRRLIAANQARLIDPTNPDLILPGQILVLPTVSPSHD